MWKYLATAKGTPVAFSVLRLSIKFSQTLVWPVARDIIRNLIHLFLCVLLRFAYLTVIKLFGHIAVGRPSILPSRYAVEARNTKNLTFDSESERSLVFYSIGLLDFSESCLRSVKKLDCSK